MKALQGHSHGQTKARKIFQSVCDLERKRKKADKNNSAEEEEEQTAKAEVRRMDGRTENQEEGTAKAAQLPQ